MGANLRDTVALAGGLPWTVSILPFSFLMVRLSSAASRAAASLIAARCGLDTMPYAALISGSESRRGTLPSASPPNLFS